MLIQIESQSANYCMVQDNLICTKTSVVPILQIKHDGVRKKYNNHTKKKNIRHTEIDLVPL
jgi:hypothetical protein